MRKLAYFFILLFSTLNLSSCEKDDICVSGDTPKLRIGFYDSAQPETAKQPIDLVIVGVDKSTALNPVVPADNQGFELLIPLNPSETSSGFYFVQNATIIEGVLGGDYERLEFNYTIDPVYRSKACGFIANYEQLNIQQLLESNWIQGISIEHTSITDENEVHVKIYH